jgi:hypothetical protein
MQIVPRLATLGWVELMMTRPADVVAADGNSRNYPKSKCRSKMPEIHPSRAACRRRLLLLIRTAQSTLRVAFIERAGT